MGYSSETFRIIAEENKELRRLLWAILDAVLTEDAVSARQDAYAFLTDSVGR